MSSTRLPIRRRAPGPTLAPLGSQVSEPTTRTRVGPIRRRVEAPAETTRPRIEPIRRRRVVAPEPESEAEPIEKPQEQVLVTRRIQPIIRRTQIEPSAKEPVSITLRRPRSLKGAPIESSRLPAGTAAVRQPSTVTESGRSGKALARLFSPPLPFVEVEIVRPTRRKSPYPVVRFQTKENPRISILHRVAINMLNLLENRGYLIPENITRIKEVDSRTFYESYTKMVRDNNLDTIVQALSGIFYHKDTNEPLYLYYPETPEDSKKTKKAQYKYLISMLGESLNTPEPVLRAILISEYPLSNTRRDTDENPAMNVETFIYSEMVYLPSEHSFNPTYQLMTDEEVKEFITDRGGSVSKLKTIASDDPIVRENSYINGDVLRIIRHSNVYNSLVPTTIEYRRVTHRTMTQK